MSLFVTFEGIEGCGKTTQVRLLAEYLRQQGRRVLTTREPGGCPIADQIRNILLHPANAGLIPRAELLLYAAARAQHVDEVIRPALSQGMVVLCDRFTDATLAYQGFGRGLDIGLISRLNDLAASGLNPQLTLLLDLPADEGLARALRRNAEAALQQEGRFELESIEFHRRVREGYRSLASEESRFRLVDARGTEEQVARRIADIMDSHLRQG